jgi:hypothetical protein
MTTISTLTPGPRLDLTHIPAANSQWPAHIPRSAFLTQPPKSPSPSQGLPLDTQADMDGTSNNMDTDTFRAGTSTSEFPNTFSFAISVPNTSSFATPVTSKRVRAASDEDASGTKLARLDNTIRVSNSGDHDDTTPKEKKVPQFAVGYVSGGKPKAADYEDVVQALLLRAMHEYESRIVGVNPYPDSENQSKWTKICWKEACRVAAEDYSMTERMSKMVCLLFPT